ncbi:MAG TPA: beta-ketoacyl-[acyl-carrier-protein] synthase family protein [Thermodesulfovibrionales bacterium]|nr:beta-ketoacyl-[acyl-carrier-protein] synthase family protein [Thermodesulfovibrionales bacterium]
MLTSSSKRRVVITGYGMVTPLGKNAEETFENASLGKSGINHITKFDATGLPCRIGGEVDDRWLEAEGDEKSRWLETFSSRGLRLAVKATTEAAGQAGLDRLAKRERIGCVLGFHADNPSVEDLVLLHRHYDGKAWDSRGLLSLEGYSSLNFLRRKPDVAAASLSRLFRCAGPTLSIASACAAGSQAIGEACRIIQNGQAEVMIAGGCDSQLNFVGFIGFVLIKALAERYSEPQKASRPFDRKRSGFVMSEGAGAVILEDLTHARARGVPILGEVLGYGVSADAYRITDTHPRGLGAIFAMKGAMEDASLSPDDIEYINAHGTSTAQNDPTETIAIKEVFGERAREIPVSSNKSMLGHTIGAAGAIEAILTLLGINRSLILPTINYEFPDPKCDLDYVPNEARKKEHRRALSNSFGFGGQNACLCIGRYDAQGDQPAGSPDSHGA